MMKKITAVLVTYNSADIVGATLAALVKEPSLERIMVVDNASQDDTCALIAADFPSVTLIRNPENVGFGSGNNVALKEVETDYAVLVNPDAVLKPGALEALLEAAARYPEAGLLAPRLFHDDGRVQPSHKANLFAREGQRGSYVEPEGDVCAEFLSGALWMVRMEALRKVGYFDESLFFYYEDDDLCLRLRAAGYALILVEAAHAVHAMGTSSAPSAESRRFRLYHDTWSRLYIEYKYRGKEMARRKSAHSRKRYHLRFLLGRALGIRSLVTRYQPRLQAADDFMRKLAVLP